MDWIKDEQPTNRTAMDVLKSIKTKYFAGRDLFIKVISEKAAGKLVLFSSVIIMILILVAVYNDPCPPQSKYTVFRILIAISCFGFSSVIPNAFKAQFSKGIRVEGAMIILLITLVWSPASIMVSKECGEKRHLTGSVWLGGQRLAGATVSAPFLNEVDQTNSSGEFDLPFDEALIGQPVELTVSFRQLEQRHQIDALNDEFNIKIELPDTVKQLTDSLLLRAIEAHVTKNQNDVKAQLKKFLLTHNKKPASRRSIEQKLAFWESIEGGERNEIVFENEFMRFNTLRSVEAAGLESDRIMLATGWGMQTPQFFLINWENEIEKGQNQSTVKLELLIFNQANDQFELVDNTSTSSQTRAKHRIKYYSPLQLVHVRLEYSPRTDWKKQSRIKVIGNLPMEEYLLEFKNSHWEVVDATLPD